MEKINIFGNQEILSNDLNLMQSKKEKEIKNRTIDIYQPGILYLKSIDKTGEFKITVNSSDATKIDIGYGIAYNLDGDRLEIFSNESVNYDTSLNWSNSVNKQDTQIPPESMPYSSGNIAIPLKDYGLDVPNFIFIDYVETVEIDPSDPYYPYGNWNAPNSKYVIDQETNRIKYPYKKNGYKIIVALLADITVIDGTPRHNLYTKAIYLGKVTANGIGNPILSNDIIYEDVNHIRKYYQHSPLAVKVKNPTDLTDVTVEYSKNKSYSLEDHIKAVGNPDLITNKNPHGLSIYDLGYTGQDLIGHRNEQHSNHIIAGTAGKNSTLSLLYITLSGAQTVRIYNLATDEYAYVKGNRITRSNIISANVMPNDDYQEFIFTSGSTPGIYYFYLDSSGVLNYTTSLSTIIANNFLLIGSSEWVGSPSYLFKIPNSDPIVQGVLDFRKFGSIGINNLQLGRYYEGDSFGGVVGQIGLFLSIKSGWLECDGSLIDYTTNPEYYDLIVYLRSLGTPFIGPGNTNAYLPNAKGRFIIGQDGVTYTPGLTGGSATHSHTTGNALGSHSHGGATNFFDVNHTHYYSGETSDVNNRSGWYSTGTDIHLAIEHHTHSFSGTTSGAISGTVNHQHGINSENLTHNHTVSTESNIPPFLTLYVCIKY